MSLWRLCGILHAYRRIQQWHDLVGRTRLTKEQSEQLRSVVVDHFEVNQKCLYVYQRVLIFKQNMAGPNS